jgi:hypothetical protein
MPAAATVAKPEQLGQEEKTGRAWPRAIMLKKSSKYPRRAKRCNMSEAL